jgi:hypothetical protein
VTLAKGGMVQMPSADGLNEMRETLGDATSICAEPETLTMHGLKLDVSRERHRSSCFTLFTTGIHSARLQSYQQTFAICLHL